MEELNLEKLKSIKRVEVSDALYLKVIDRIAQRKRQIISLYKAGIAASLVLGLFTTQLIFLNYLSNKQDNPYQQTELVKLTDNALYNE